MTFALPRCSSRQGWLGTAASPTLPAVPGVEDALNVTMAQRAELDCLIYNDPLGYADLIPNGDPKEYLKNAAGSRRLEI